MSKVAIIDYGVGNIFNVIRALEAVDTDAILTSSKDEINNASHVILPGVGAFGEGIKKLRDQNLESILSEQVKSGKPVMGICLGMQLLMSSSEEFGNHKGLDFIQGSVNYFERAKNKEFKVPHMGWNQISISNKTKDLWDGTIFKDVSNNSFMYFVHSLFVTPNSNANMLSSTEYGYQKFCSAVVKDNIYGCQFHPERSGPEGLKILENFVNL